MNEPLREQLRLGKRTPRCAYCETDAEYFCDEPGCDLPICRAHRVCIGHVCYRGKNKRESGTIDVCRAHREKESTSER